MKNFLFQALGVTLAPSPEPNTLYKRSYDCAYIAISQATGISYKDVIMDTSKISAEWGIPSTSLLLIHEYLKPLGYKMYGFRNTVTVGEFVYRFKHTTCIVAIHGNPMGHVFYYKNGVWYDNPESIKKGVLDEYLPYDFIDLITQEDLIAKGLDVEPVDFSDSYLKKDDDK